MSHGGPFFRRGSDRAKFSQRTVFSGAGPIALGAGPIARRFFSDLREFCNSLQIFGSVTELGPDA